MFFLLLILLLLGPPAGSPAPDNEPTYYAVERQASVFARPDSSEVYLRLGFREPVRVLGEKKGWVRIRTQSGATGYVRSSAISDVWIRVSKRRKTLYLYRGARLVSKVRADFGYNNFADKEQRGSRLERDHWRTPEGTFYVVAKNPTSQFYKALVLNYPTAEDAERGLRRGVISEGEHRAIVEAQDAFEVPPMGTALGGWIEIHGEGTGQGQDWTHGCVAVHNTDMNELWRWAQVGTPVIIE